jgi:hypothetical protein
MSRRLSHLVRVWIGACAVWMAACHSSSSSPPVDSSAVDAPAVDAPMGATTYYLASNGSDIYVKLVTTPQTVPF